MWFRIYFCLLLISSLTACASAEQGDQIVELEQSVCGFKEPLLFWLWSSQAGSPDEKRLRGLTNAEEITLQTDDGRKLRGYRLHASASDKQLRRGKPKGYLLVLQGNAMLADQILGEFRRYADAGYDVYIYDYRGYGRSEGKRRLKAIVHDYSSIISALNAGSYEEKLVYAMSIGGIIFLNALTAENQPDRVVIDSSPSRLSDYGCPANYDPINHLPSNCANFMLIVGQQDRVVNPSMSRDMLEIARQRGAEIVKDSEFSHPFMDLSWSVHQRRMRLIEKHLLQQE
jgi:alpha/beta superfamily hydrolase